MTDYTADATAAANQYGVPPSIFLGLIQQESAWNPNAYSSAGAIGLTQLEPGTAADLGVNPWDPLQNLQGGAEYLAQMFKQFGNWTDALGAYNAGPGAYAKIKAGTQSEPAETSNYITSVLGNAQALGFNGQNSTAATGTNAVVTTPSGATVNSSGNASTDWLNGILGISPLSGSTYSNPSTGQTVTPAQTGGVNSTPLAQIGQVFTADFWQGAIIDILVVLAIVALVIFGGWRAIKSGASSAA